MPNKCQTAFILANLCFSLEAASHKFPISRYMANQAGFWYAIFTRHSEKVSVIHDTRDVSLIIDVVDLRKVARKKGWTEDQAAHKRDRTVRAYIRRYEVAIGRFAREGRKAVRHGPMENRIYQVYRKNYNGSRRLMAGQVTLRAQPGLREEFFRALKRSSSLIPFMEKEFHKQGLPHQLTRLPFVESMFNNTAYSKAGAAGIWQFIPATGRRYLRIDKHIDERRSPYKATVAAAQLLAENHEKLGSWPLAVTAYNHGRQGVVRAVEAVNSKNLDVIVKRYRSSSFRFASRNFYAELIAAIRAYNDATGRRYSLAGRQSVVPVDVGQLSLGHLLAVSNIPLGDFQGFTTEIRPRAWKYFQRRALPNGFKVFLPKRYAAKVSAKINTLKRASKPKKAKRRQKT